MRKIVTSLAFAATLVMGSSAAVQAAFIVNPVSAVDNGHYPGGASPPQADSTQTINGSGLSDGGTSVSTGSPIPASYPTTTADPSAPSFFSNYAILTLIDDPSGPAIPQITYSLGAAYSLTGGHFWQYSGDRESSGERSLTSADIQVSSDGVAFTPAGVLVPGYVEGPYGSTDPGVDFSLIGTFNNVSFVRLTNLLAPGDHDIRVAFNEIRFTAVPVPEPATCVLMGLGLACLVAAARRRRSA